MVISNVTKLFVVTKKETVSAKNPSRKFFKLGVMTSDDELGEISCSEEIFNSVEKGKEYNFTTSYNDTYKSFRIEGIVASK